MWDAHESTMMIETLKEQTNEILSTILSHTDLESFTIFSTGAKTRRWHNPKNLMHREKTGLFEHDAAPLHPEHYANVLAKISYSLSSTDQRTFNKAKRNAERQREALLNAWWDAYGGLPYGNGDALQNIISTVAGEWAQPSVTLSDMNKSVHLRNLLNHVPLRGEPILPALEHWLAATAEVNRFEQMIQINHDFLLRALESALNSAPSSKHKSQYPLHHINTMEEMICAFNQKTERVDVSLRIEHEGAVKHCLSIRGGSSILEPINKFIAAVGGGSTHYNRRSVTPSQQEAAIEMRLPGLLLLRNEENPEKGVAPNQYHWITPILEAIHNQHHDITGFKFIPDSRSDHSKNSPFAFLKREDVADYPSIVISVKSNQPVRLSTQGNKNQSDASAFFQVPNKKLNENKERRDETTPMNTACSLLRHPLPSSGGPFSSEQPPIGWVPRNRSVTDQKEEHKKNLLLNT
jgi:hypothetical protein